MTGPEAIAAAERLQVGDLITALKRAAWERSRSKADKAEAALRAALLQSQEAIVAAQRELRGLGKDAQKGTTPNLAERIWDVADALEALLSPPVAPKEP